MEHQSSKVMVKGVSLAIIVALLAGVFTLSAPEAKADVIGGPYGEEVNVAVLNGLTSDDPASITTAEEWKIMTLVYDSLARTDPVTLDSIPWVAESWDINVTGDSPVATVELNDVTWHDGTTMTAADVIASYNIMADNPMYSSILSGISISGTGTTVIFTLDEPKGNFVTQVLQVPLVKADGTGSGPFVLASEYNANPIRLEAFDDYFNGRPYVNAVNFHVYDSPAFAGEKLDPADPAGPATQLGIDWYSGNLDLIAWSIEPFETATPMTLEDGSVGTVGDWGGVKLSPGMNYFYLGLNLDVAPLDDPVFRQAISMSCDKTQIALVDFSNYATAADSPVLSVNSFWYNPNLEYMGLVDKDGSGKVVSEELAPIRAFLGANGYNDVDGDGWRDLPDGSPFHLTVLAPPTAGADADLKVDAVYGRLEAVWTSLGIKVEKVDAGLDAMWTDVEAGSFDMYLNYQDAEIDPAYLEDLFGTDGAMNYGSFSNATFDALIDEAATAMDPAVRQEKVRAAQEILNYQMPIVPLTYPKHTELYNTSTFQTGWVSTAGGLHNFWTYTSLRQPVVDDLNIIVTSHSGASVESGEEVTVTATVTVHGTGSPATGAYVNFELNGMGTLSSTEQVIVDENGVATVTYTAPTVTSPTDVFITAKARQESYNGADYTIGMTVHEVDKYILIDDVDIDDPTLLSGDETTVTIVVLDQNGDPVNDATVTATLSLENFGGTISAPEATGSNGEYTCTFSAVVTLKTRYTIEVTAAKDGYMGDSDDKSQITVEPRILSVTIAPTDDVITLAKAGGEGETTLTVTVRDDTGVAVAGATVTLVLSPDGTDSELNTATATTDANGVATFTFTGSVEEDTTYRIDVTAEMDGYVSAEDACNVLVYVEPPTDSFIPAPGLALAFLALLGAALVLVNRK